MSQQSMVSNTGTTNSKKGGLTAGLILVGIGAGLFLSQITHLEWLFPLALGLAFLIAGVLSRKVGLIIPGGIVGGVGLGVIAVENAWFVPQNSPASGGIFLLTFAIGWFMITLLSKLFTDDTQLWPMIPGGVMMLIGGLVMMGETGLKILEQLGFYWPVILIVVGLGILYQWWRSQR